MVGKKTGSVLLEDSRFIEVPLSLSEWKGIVPGIISFDRSLM
jgi:hypothetical protein